MSNAVPWYIAATIDSRRCHFSGCTDGSWKCFYHTELAKARAEASAERQRQRDDAHALPY